MAAHGSDDSKGKKPAPAPAPTPTSRNVHADLFGDSVVTIDPQTQALMRQAAPEVSQGAWRERAFQPRGTMPKDELLNGMKRAVGDMLLIPGELEGVRAALKAGWLPFLRQAVEQAGGDGLDVVLLKLLGRPKKEAKEPLVEDLLAAYDRLNRATSMEALRVEAEAVMARIAQALDGPQPARISLKVLEEELEGRLDVDEILAALTLSDAELTARLAQVRQSLDTLRNELRGGLGGAPTSLLWNFTRIKAERIIIESERRRRGLA